MRCLVIALLLSPVMAVCAPDQEVREAATADENAVRRAAVEKRVAAKWDALIRRDFAAAYEFTSPAYRKASSLDAFKHNFGSGKVVWRRVEVVSVKFEGDNAATVGIKIHILYYGPQSLQPVDMATHDQESWVYENGQWWYVVKK
jgi:hypothetical protein